ncbi:orotidine-5'-phosphate decarboxylase [Corynebacterium poyangense]|uniref:Orotidine 5'-phosphate decarboxylase n=1 Tax=Corynebacterium poyangense TaxID=2684405 RepID=A0A7H0SP22_9CORY|nr:orotidine-5'-phosphate decarboxylase [Corynebacterium poyangense]MBZ8177860.1 orotidine-5'-phosphate decarboxylase [Corynebacterium poyangense]QNQ90297.1 orotidine-5'-phosphate decarboxylase [Corynebacterium poyangense]
MTPFGVRLLDLSAQRGRLCVGIDPHEQLLSDWGLDVSVDGLRRFSDICVEAFAEHAVLVKPQVAFYERFGSAGYHVLEETIRGLRAGGALVLADAKRGDIGSTMEGYAQAWLAPDAPLSCDALTLSPFLGVDSLEPAFRLAQTAGAGIFVLAATSNPEAKEIQQRSDASGCSVSQHIVDGLARRNAEAGHLVGSLGVVVGATLTQPPSLGSLNGPVLLPGVGAQGADHDDVARICAGVEKLAFPNISRGILRCGPDLSALRESFFRARESFPGV